MVRRVAPLALLLMTSLLAGCAAEDGDKGSQVRLADGETVTLLEEQNEAGKGSISGVIVDEAIRPLANVPVQVNAGQTNVSTSSDGLFLISGLEPGLYTLRVEGFTDAAANRRYLNTQSTAEVVAGQTAKVRIVLPVDPQRLPYHSDTLKFDGFYQVGSGFVDEILDLFADACSQCRFPFVTDGNVSTFVLELVYENTVPPPEPTFWTMDLNSETESGSLIFCETPSPCVMHVDGAAYPADDRDYEIAVWTDPAWVHVNQAFQLYVTTFYLEPAPEGWSFVAGDR